MAFRGRQYRRPLLDEPRAYPNVRGRGREIRIISGRGFHAPHPGQVLREEERFDSYYDEGSVRPDHNFRNDHEIYDVYDRNLKRPPSPHREHFESGQGYQRAREYADVDRDNIYKNDSVYDRRYPSPPYRPSRRSPHRSPARSPHHSPHRRDSRRAQSPSFDKSKSSRHADLESGRQSPSGRKSRNHRHESDRFERSGSNEFRKDSVATSGANEQIESRLAAVEKAKEMAMRTREIISKLGGLKQLASLKDPSPPAAVNAVPPAVNNTTETTLPEPVVSNKPRATESTTAISKIRQNESLVKYAFNIPVSDCTDDIESYSADPNPALDNVSSHEAEDDKLFDYSRGIPSSADDEDNVTDRGFWAGNERTANSAVYQPENVEQWKSDERSSSPSPGTNCDPTIANILKSIGFNLGVSEWLASKAQATATGGSHVNTTKASFPHSHVSSVLSKPFEPVVASSARGSHLAHNVEQPMFEAERMGSDQFVSTASKPFMLSSTTPVTGSMFMSDPQSSSYGEMVKTLHVERGVPYGVPDFSTETKQPAVRQLENTSLYPFATNYFNSEPPGIQNAPTLVDQNIEMKLKYKALVHKKVSKKDAALYEDFSDSDESFVDTTNGQSVKYQGESQLPSFDEPHPGMAPARSAPSSDDIAWVNSTDAFLRKLQQPRSQPTAVAGKLPERQVTIGPKKDQSGRKVTASALKTTIQHNTQLEGPKEQILFQTVVPLEELKTIRKTIVVSEKTAEPVKSVANKSSVEMKSDSNEKSSLTSDVCKDTVANVEKSKSTKPDGKKITVIKHKEVTTTTGKLIKQSEKKLDEDGNVPDEKANAERQRKIDLLVAELESLRRKQSLLLRRKRREKDGHNDPVLVELSKLQEDMTNQIALLKQKQDEGKLSAEKASAKDSSNIERKSDDEESPDRKRKRSVTSDSNSARSQSTDSQAKSKYSKSRSHSRTRSHSKNRGRRSRQRSQSPKFDASKYLAQKRWRSRSRNRGKSRSRSASRSPQEPPKSPKKKQNATKNSAPGVQKATVQQQKRKPKRLIVRTEYVDGGSHFCRCCNIISANVFEHCQHLLSASHKQNVDPCDKPWAKIQTSEDSSENKAAQKAGTVVNGRIRGVEFLMSTEAFYCSLCHEFIGSTAIAELHFKSEIHNKNYVKYLDDNQYYERRLNLDKAAVSVMTLTKPSAEKPSPVYGAPEGVMTKAETLTPLEASLMEAKLKSKERAELLLLFNPPIVDENELPQMPRKKSRVVPKGQISRLTDDDLVKLLAVEEGQQKQENAAASKVETENPPNESVAGVQSSECSGSGPSKKNLPFIGKRPAVKTVWKVSNQLKAKSNTDGTVTSETSSVDDSAAKVIDRFKAAMAVTGNEDVTSNVTNSLLQNNQEGRMQVADQKAVGSVEMSSSQYDRDHDTQSAANVLEVSVSVPTVRPFDSLAMMQNFGDFEILDEYDVETDQLAICGDRSLVSECLPLVNDEQSRVAAATAGKVNIETSDNLDTDAIEEATSDVADAIVSGELPASIETDENTQLESDIESVPGEYDESVPFESDSFQETADSKISDYPASPACAIDETVSNCPQPAALVTSSLHCADDVMSQSSATDTVPQSNQFASIGDNGSSIEPASLVSVGSVQTEPNLVETASFSRFDNHVIDEEVRIRPLASSFLNSERTDSTTCSSSSVGQSADECNSTGHCTELPRQDNATVLVPSS